MKSTINPKDGLKVSHRKDSKFQREITGFDAQLRPIVTLRIYESNTKTYCCVWVNMVGASGSAAAGGYGYHKASQAAESAFSAAGITFDQHWGGSGDYAIEEAVRATMQALGLPNCFIHTAHP